MLDSYYAVRVYRDPQPCFPEVDAEGVGGDRLGTAHTLNSKKISVAYLELARNMTPHKDC